ncbi:LPD7 domain-containing protein [Burkholderia pyrrocinia]|uniref:LPD7 domain-containing protein n=1 Tax=Burkholderia pyrrocinia TaxID=60550 RepID=A0ABZ3BN05_BURPY
MAVLIDDGTTLWLLQIDQDVIRMALRLAQEKFGRTLSLSGPLKFQLDAARVAAQVRLNIEFDDPALNRVMHDRRLEKMHANDPPPFHTIKRRLQNYS